jgi:hypothetical protein
MPDPRGTGTARAVRDARASATGSALREPHATATSSAVPDPRATGSAAPDSRATVTGSAAPDPRATATADAAASHDGASPVATAVEQPAATAAGSPALREQVDAFRRARALAPVRAVLAWRAILKRWPDSPLREEAQAALIGVLVRLRRYAEAKNLARDFLDRFPASARAPAIRAIAKEDR